MPSTSRLLAAALATAVLSACSTTPEATPDAATTPSPTPTASPTAAATPVSTATDVVPGICSTVESDGAVPDAQPQQVFTEVPAVHPSVDDYGDGEVVLRRPDGTIAWTLPVLVADTAAERQHGLMEVPSMPDGTGMVFLYEDDGDRTGGYWMFGTLMDIDIAYVGADGHPADACTMVPCPEQPCPPYPPRAPYRFTLEVPGGFWERIGFGTDWTVEVTAR